MQNYGLAAMCMAVLLLLHGCVAPRKDTAMSMAQLRSSYEELLSLPLILLEDNTSTRRYTDGFLREQGVVIRPEFELATSDMLVQFARKNLGIACVVSDFAQEYVDSGELFELEFDRRIPQRSMYMIVDRHNPVSLAAKNLLQMLHVKLI